MTQFIELIESGFVADHQFNSRDVRRGLQALHQRCQKKGRLEVAGVWRLHRSEVRGLEEAAQFRPPGGWRGLCSLAVGTGVLRAESEGFEPGPVSCESWSDDEVSRRLVEAFTRWLIPPSTAAGLFLAMGIHPMWGLRLARRLHVDAPILSDFVEGWRDDDLFPEQSLDQLRRGVFAALSVVFSGLRRLQPDHRYGRGPLVEFIAEAMAFGCAQIEENPQGLAVLIDSGDPEKTRQRSMEFAARELIDAVLIPAGVMRRFDDQTFAVDAGALKKVQVGSLGIDGQRNWLRIFLVSESAVHVA